MVGVILHHCILSTRVKHTPSHQFHFTTEYCTHFAWSKSMLFYSLQSEKHGFQSQTKISFVVVFSLVLNSKPKVLHTLDFLSKTELIPKLQTQASVMTMSLYQLMITCKLNISVASEFSSVEQRSQFCGSVVSGITYWGNNCWESAKCSTDMIISIYLQNHVEISIFIRMKKHFQMA